MSETTISIDAGGTFTDGFFDTGDRAVTAKVPTTEHDLTVCFWECIQKGADKLEVQPATLLSEATMVRFSTTLGTNTIIEKTGPRLGVLVTAGHEETLYARTSDKTVADSVVSPEMVAGIDEQTAADGTVRQEPDAKQVTDAVKRLQSEGARHIVIALGNSAANPSNERTVKRMIADAYPRHYLGAIPTLAAFEVTARPSDYRRLNTVAMNAYIHRPMKSSLYRAEDRVRDRGYERPLFVGDSSGRISRVSKSVALNTYNSGPAAGVLGAAAVADHYDTDLVTMDMGGTSIDISRVDAGMAVPRDLRPEIDDIPTNLPAIDVHTAGAGGGSLATVADGVLSVGPESAGANPGPACFGRGGTEPTVTDADLLTGRLNPEYFLGGSYDLDPERAETAMQKHVASRLDVHPTEAAGRIIEQIEETMSTVVKNKIGTADGLLSYGGAGPVHAAGVANRLDIDTVYVVPYSSVFSAFGASTTNVEHSYTRALTEGAHRVLLSEMRNEAERDMRAEGFNPETIEFRVDLLIERPEGTTRRELPVNFSAEGEPDTDSTLTDVPRDETTLRLRSIGSAPSPEIRAYETTDDSSASPVATRDVMWGETMESTPIYRRTQLQPGTRLSGPAVVEAVDTTIVVPEDRELQINEFDHCVLERA